MATWFTSSIRLGGSSDDWGNSRHRRGGMCCMQMRLAEFCISIYPTRTLKRWTLQSGLGRRFSKRLWLFLIVILGVRCQVRCSHSPSCLPQEKEEELKRQEDRHLRQLLIRMIRQVTWNLRNMDSERQAKSGKYCTYMYVYYATQWLKHVEPYFLYLLLMGQPFKWRWAHHPSTSRHPSLFPSWQVAVRSNRGRRTSSWWKDVLHKRSRSEIQGHGSTLPQLFWPVLVQCLNRFKSSTSLSLSDTIWHIFHFFPSFSLYRNTM